MNLIDTTYFHTSINIPNIDSISAVSYTHLDVYKRQNEGDAVEVVLAAHTINQLKCGQKAGRCGFAKVYSTAWYG